MAENEAQGFVQRQHALADSHTGHHDDELLEPVAARQLEDRAQIDVGLTRTGFHLDGKVCATARLVGRAIEEIPRLRGHCGVGHVDVVAGLNSAKVLPQLVLGQEQAVSDAHLCTVLPAKQSAHVADIDYCILGRANRLPVKKVSDSRYGVSLELLVRVKLQLHRSRLRKRTARLVAQVDAYELRRAQTYLRATARHSTTRSTCSGCSRSIRSITIAPSTHSPPIARGEPGLRTTSRRSSCDQRSRGCGRSTTPHQ